MAKDTIAGRGLWDSYSNKVREHMNNPKNLGIFTKEDAQKENLRLVDAVHGSEACGDAIELFLLIDNKGIIKKAKFKSFGCGTAIAAADVMADLCIGKTIDQALKITNLEVERALRDNPDIPAVPGQKMHCSVMAYDVIKKAAAAYKNIDVKEFEEEEIICHCGRITRKQIEDAIINKELNNIDDVVKETKAGSYCGSCIKPGGHEEKNVYIVDILEEIKNRNKGKKEMQAFPSDKPFKELTIPLKLKKIETILDNNIRPSLATDKGGVEVMDFRDNKIYIKYTGHCAVCASANQGTMSFIRKTIKEKIDTDLDVLLY